MNHVMLDLETLGTVPGSVILSVGATAFDPHTGELGSKYYSVINSASCMAQKLVAEESTLKWWEEQSWEAQSVLREQESAPDVTAVLDGFAEYLKTVGDPSTIRVWGNGSDFDNAMMACAFRAIERPLPWQFFNNRCYRTLKSLATNCRIERGNGTRHNALDDACAQARHLAKVAESIRLVIS